MFKLYMTENFNLKVLKTAVLMCSYVRGYKVLLYLYFLYWSHCGLRVLPTGRYVLVSCFWIPARIKKRAAHFWSFLGGLLCTGNLAFRLQ